MIIIIGHIILIGDYFIRICGGMDLHMVVHR